MDEKPKSEGLFRRILRMEFILRLKISKQLADYRSLIEKCIELGIEVSTLKGEAKAPLNLVVAGLFLKRTIKDMRSVLELLQMGYTAQAASVTASLFENALVVMITARNLENAQNVWDSINDPDKDIPWKVIEMCEMSVLRDGKKRSEDELRYKTLCDYVSYKWLCRQKHPTLDSAFHDASSTKIGGRYSMIPIPDDRQEDLSHKVMIAEIALTKFFFCIKEFADGMEILNSIEQNKNAKNWIYAMGSLHTKWAETTQKQNLNLQYLIKGSGIYQEMQVLRSKLGKDK